MFYLINDKYKDNQIFIKKNFLVVHKFDLR